MLKSKSHYEIFMKGSPFIKEQDAVQKTYPNGNDNFSSISVNRLICNRPQTNDTVAFHTKFDNQLTVNIL